MSTRDERLNEDTANSYLEELDAFWRHYDYADKLEEPERSERLDALQEELNEWPLELVAKVGSPFEIVLALGGPDVRVVWDGRYGTDNARLELRWWSGPVTRTSEGISRLAEYFEELMVGEE